MSRSEREAKVASHRLAASALEPLRKAVQVISPTVTRRPVLDSMLGNIAIIGQGALEDMRDRVLNGHQMDQDELGDFTKISEGVFKQARLEMAVEKHVEQRTGSMDTESLAAGVAESLGTVLRRFHLKDEIVTNITTAVLFELGLDET